MCTLWQRQPQRSLWPSPRRIGPLSSRPQASLPSFGQRMSTQAVIRPANMTQLSRSNHLTFPCGTEVENESTNKLKSNAKWALVVPLRRPTELRMFPALTSLNRDFYFQISRFHTSKSSLGLQHSFNVLFLSPSTYSLMQIYYAVQSTTAGFNASHQCILFIAVFRAFWRLTQQELGVPHQSPRP